MWCSRRRTSPASPRHSIPAPSATMKAAMRSTTPKPCRWRRPRPGPDIEGSVDRSVVSAGHWNAAQTSHRPGPRPSHPVHPRLQGRRPIADPVPAAQQAASPGICQSPPNATPVPLLPAAQFQNIQNQYINALNTGLNNRFAARVAGCQATAALHRQGDTDHHRRPKPSPALPISRSTSSTAVDAAMLARSAS